MTSLKGKTALVTGSAKRIGKALALALAGQGCNMVVHYNTSKKEAKETLKEIHALGVKAVAVQADLGTGKGVEKLVHASMKAFGKIDILVNNASSFERDSVQTLQNRGKMEKHFRKAIGDNLFSAYALSVGLGWNMKQQGSGDIIMMGDAAHVTGKLYPDFLTYHIGKGALISLMRALALELGPEVRVNMIANGLVLAPEGMAKARQNELASRSPARKWLGTESVVHCMLKLLKNGKAYGKIVRNDGTQALK